MRPIVLTLIAVAVPLGASAQTPVPDLAGALRSGDTVYVLDHALRETVGVFGRRTDDGIRLMVGGELRDFPMADVQQITRRGGDPIWNGALVGAAIGGVAAGVSTEHVGMAVGGAVIYGAIGALVDWAVPGRVSVYRAPARRSAAMMPIVDGAQRGLRVAVSF
jgi:hypothetical protein